MQAVELHLVFIKLGVFLYLKNLNTYLKSARKMRKGSIIEISDEKCVDQCYDDYDDDYDYDHGNDDDYDVDDDDCDDDG